MRISNAGRHLAPWKLEDSGRWRVRGAQRTRLEIIGCQHHLARHPPRVSPSLAETFAQLRDTWRQQTAHLSSTTARVLHPAYQRIIGLGRSALPLLLTELKDRPAQWTWALRAVAGEDPVPQTDRGTLRKEREAWLAWGRRNGLI